MIKNIPFLLRHYFSISRFEKWSPAKIEKYQIKQFQKILARAKEIPFYKDLYESAGILNKPIKNLNDLSCLPTIDKAFCREKGYEDFFKNKNIPKTIVTPTSGSTGKPFQIIIPSKIEMIPPLKVVHAMRQYGWNPFYKGLEIWREDKSTHKGLMRKLGLLKSISIFKPVEEIKNTISIEKPDFLFCNRTFFTVLSEYFKSIDFSYTPQYLLCTAEEVRVEHRKKLEDSFNTKLINVYGCMESPTLAYSCPEHNNLHIFQTTVIVEIINKRIIDGEEYGDIAITNLTNDLMPFIRYKTGDVVKVISSKCKCHRNSQIIGDIIGRSDDVIKFKDGRVFNYIHIWQRFRQPILIENPTFIEQYKVWFKKNEDKLLFQFKLSNNVIKDEGIVFIRKMLQTYFSDVNYDFEIVNEIVISKSGKFKIIEVIED